MLTKIGPYWKAVVGFFAPAASVLMLSMQDSSLGGSAITGNEWFAAFLTSVITAASVYKVANKPV